MAIHREGGGLAARDGGGNTMTEVTDWHRVFSFGKVGISGRMLYGFIYRRRTDVWDAGRSYTSMDYATKKELFNLKLRGKA